MTALTVIILTRDEALHIKRAIASVTGFAQRIVVVDSGSTDDTVALARAAGAEVLQNAWVNYATQFNWALGQIRDQPGWVLRLDADEVVSPTLAREIAAGLPDVDGLTVPRRIMFQGQMIRFGGVGRVPALRLFRNRAGHCEDRWMDEHIIVDGPVAALKGELIDDNRKSLGWWIEKHNSYASREAVDLLNLRYGFLPLRDTPPANRTAAIKRWIKIRVYAWLPGGIRAGLYFFYRYLLCAGCLEGKLARRFHVLQGFWYRYLVDAKLADVQRCMQMTGADAPRAIEMVLGIDVTGSGKAKASKAA
ncbi:MAG: glycosyltransferase family 2 protein [Pseudomonadota bacterium]